MWLIGVWLNSVWRSMPFPLGVAHSPVYNKKDTTHILPDYTTFPSLVPLTITSALRFLPGLITRIDVRSCNRHHVKSRFVVQDAVYVRA